MQPTTKFFKLFLFFFINISFSIYSQQLNPVKSSLSPAGSFDNIFDNMGNRYSLNDIVVSNQSTTNSNNSVVLSCGTSSIFELYFEPGCGMTSLTDQIEIDRRTVLCQVFQDISNFINTPLTNAGNTQKVKIWVRNINNLPNVPSSALGLATSFYVLPISTTYNNIVQGGIVDNEIWKTIHTGKDSYINVTAPLNTNSQSAISAGSFYHGMVALNFNSNSGTPIINWHTTPLSSLAPINKYDLYSVVLHEVLHALGFNSLINQYGNSLLEPGYKYYTRYDSFLKNNATNQYLIVNSSIPNTSSMYNYFFNPNTASITTDVLHPNCSNSPTFENTGGSINSTVNCSDALKFVGSNFTVPIYTPTCFERGSSFSHFEDMLYPSCTIPTPYGMIIILL